MIKSMITENRVTFKAIRTACGKTEKKEAKELIRYYRNIEDGKPPYQSRRLELPLHPQRKPPGEDPGKEMQREAERGNGKAEAAGIRRKKSGRAVRITYQ